MVPSSKVFVMVYLGIAATKPCEASWENISTSIECMREFGGFNLGASSGTVAECLVIASCMNDELGLFGGCALDCEPNPETGWSQEILWINAEDSDSETCTNSAEMAVKKASGAIIVGAANHPAMLMVSHCKPPSCCCW
jgi:hypothetical protein